MKNLFVISFLPLLINCTPIIKSAETTSTTSTEILKQKLKENPFLVDVRTPQEFAEGSAKGAVNIPLEEIPKRISEFEGKKNIITFCVTGKRSTKAISILNENGIKDVTNGIGLENVKKLQDKKFKF
ncbi:rhodanese-like domain-containing protein [Halpernia sp.]|uniref:rhodanese-like domain-containing protein n=1 Tax=Halpernia sp. TaxID=2782209 RepID=UPI003A9442CD